MRPFIWLVFLALLGEIRFMFRWWAVLAREARKERRRRHEKPGLLLTPGGTDSAFRCRADPRNTPNEPELAFVSARARQSVPVECERSQQSVPVVRSHPAGRSLRRSDFQRLRKKL